MNSHESLIATLARSEMFENYGNAFTETTGMPMALRPVETWQLPLHGQRGENPFCAMIAGQSRTCAACLQMQAKLGEAAASAPCAMSCAYGLCELAVPVKLGAQTLGFLQTGQVMTRKPTESSFRQAVEKARSLGVDIDNAKTKAAYFATPVAPRKKLAAATTLLSLFADHLSIQSHQIAVRAANAEPPVITKARQFIREHHKEELSLGQVAAAVHTSVFYFCKLFRKTTGTTFTEFVSRTRVEAAKNLLLNPNLRVSEIAYEVGFQSLTHFNRVFKKIIGESPTDYRGRLPKAV